MRAAFWHDLGMIQAVDEITHALNRTEHGYAAIDGAAGTMAQPYMLRLNAPVAEADVRRAMRSLISHHPRLRGVVAPGLYFRRLRILPGTGKRCTRSYPWSVVWGSVSGMCRTARALRWSLPCRTSWVTA